MAKECCTFEALVKGVMFYGGHTQLKTNIFSQLSFERDYTNIFHSKAYFAKIVDRESYKTLKLGHLSRSVSEAFYQLLAIPGVAISIM